MKINKILEQYENGVSFEFFPPKTDVGMKKLIAKAQILKEYKPLYVSMTYGAAGVTQERTKEAVFTLLKDKNSTVMPHLTCIGAKEEALKNLLNEYEIAGIENIMALRGDPPQGCGNFDFKNQDFCYALDLIKFIKKNYNFCIGAAVYPEGHIETSSLEQDLEFTKQKVDAGVDFAVTQMFFDNSYYYSFLDRARKSGINIPILPGILPLTSLDKLKQFISVCRTTIPKKIEEAMSCFSNSPEDMEKVGIDWTIKQCQGLKENGDRKLHFFTLNKPEVMAAVLDAIK
ncbi:MAG: methylenetetrahydrofolate reductase [NAD(P)H] [Candidatus Omnitrophota bacterium]